MKTITDILEKRGELEQTIAERLQKEMPQNILTEALSNNIKSYLKGFDMAVVFMQEKEDK